MLMIVHGFRESFMMGVVIDVYKVRSMKARSEAHFFDWASPARPVYF
jgi:hypothetical protein